MHNSSNTKGVIMKLMYPLIVTTLLFSGCGGDTQDVAGILESSSETSSTLLDSKVALGEVLFNDINLSLNRTMSCATCHNPDHAFIDTRTNNLNGAVSVGADGVSLGDRNAPTISYALLSPDFSNDGAYLGGQFFDGRASNLNEQAKGPFLNSVEMQMPNESSVVARILENPLYVEAFENLYGNTIFDDPQDVFNALADAIAIFENTTFFAPFNSKFDRVRAGTESFTAQEALGQQLFRQHRCVTCHDDRNQALFTNFRYENIGIPINSDVRIANAKGLSFIDHGLLENPNVSSNNEDGKFKTPTLRNVAISAPYMHNGVFQDLKTVVHFYNTRDVSGALNPETSAPWESSEVNNNRVGGNRVGDLGLSESEEDAIVAFLLTLTDAQYEHLLP